MNDANNVYPRRVYFSNDLCIKWCKLFVGVLLYLKLCIKLCHFYHRNVCEAVHTHISNIPWYCIIILHWLRVVCGGGEDERLVWIKNSGGNFLCNIHNLCKTIKINVANSNKNLLKMSVSVRCDVIHCEASWWWWEGLRIDTGNLREHWMNKLRNLWLTYERKKGDKFQEFFSW